MTLTLVQNDDGLTEHRFTVAGANEQVPGLLWSPDGGPKPAPTILVGHGRSGSKRSPYTLELARRFTGRGWNVASIDAPGHGERRPPGTEGESPRPSADETARDWRAAVEFLRAEAGLDTGRLGYWGVSMGTSLGISAIIGEPGVRAAVLGLMHSNWPAPPGTRIRADAARLTCPVLFLVNWDDTRAPRASAFELYDLIASPDKRLHAYPGEHGQLPDEAFAASGEFLARYL